MNLLQAHTKELFNAALQNTPHGLLFSGPEGAGKLHTAKLFIIQKLQLASAEALEAHPYIRIVTPDNNSIKIDQVRELQRFLQLKVPGNEDIRRIAIIEDAHLMTNEAQNALLKSLEEPPPHTLLILTATASLKLKETILSRVQRVPVLALGREQVFTALEGEHSADALEKAYLMSGGRRGLLRAILQNEDHVLSAAVQQAKELLQKPLYDRMLMVDGLSKDREALTLFLHACRLICMTALKQASEKQETTRIKKWHTSLQSVYEAEASLSHTPNAKLLITNVLFNM